MRAEKGKTQCLSLQDLCFTGQRTWAMLGVSRLYMAYAHGTQVWKHKGRVGTLSLRHLISSI